MVSARIGVLALQGDFAAHVEALRSGGVETEEVRYASQLDRLDGLILPGGESTTLLKLLRDLSLETPLRRFHARGGAVFGTCAGAILVARRVTNPEQPSLGLIDIEIERNAYGRQIDSFETDGSVPALGKEPLRLVFIRAPRIRRVGPGVEVIASLDGEPILVRQERVLAGTFHPELSGDPRVHRLFAAMAEVAAGRAVTAS
jgi:5'-phosphate synthase pdxT subunit